MMFCFKILPSVMASACVMAVVAPVAFAQRPIPLTHSAGLAQAAGSNTAKGLEGQPQTVQQLTIEDLTDEQVAQINAIFAAYQSQIDVATRDYLAALAVLNDLLVPSTADLAIINARNSVVTAEQRVNDLTFQRNLAIRSVLTLEQRQVINNYLRELAGIPPAEPMAVFPQTLVGQNAQATLTSLQADGWVVVVQTPAYVGLNRGSQKLNLDIGRNGEVLAADLGQ